MTDEARPVTEVAWIVVVLLHPPDDRPVPGRSEMTASLGDIGPIEIVSRSTFGYLVRGRFTAGSSTAARRRFMDVLHRVEVLRGFEIIGTSTRMADDQRP